MGHARKGTIVILSSDEEDELDQTPIKSLPLNPSKFNQPTQPSLQPKPKSVMANPPNAFFGGGVHAVQPSKTSAPTPPASLDDEDELKDGEEVVVPDFKEDEHRYISPADAEKALRDLMGGAMNQDVEVEMKPDDVIVQGFKPEFTLLPHQVIGRSWMKGREDPKNKRMGGILADDMGYFCFVDFVH